MARSPYSEVFEGRFDGARLARYLSGIASSQEEYAGHTIYTVPVEGRSLRIAQLGYDTIAASNMPTTEQIHAMLDRYRASASPFSGSSLLAARYRDVPLLSSAWAIGHVGLPFSERGHIAVFGLALPLPEDTTLSPACATASARCTCASSRSPPLRQTPPAPPRRWTRCCTSSRPSSPRLRRNRMMPTPGHARVHLLHQD